MVRYSYFVSMNIEARKLHFIEGFLTINDERLIEKLENVLRSEQQSLDPVLQEKLSSRASKSEEDIAAGRIMTREELEHKLDARLGI